MDWHGRVVEVKEFWSKESTFVPVSRENLLSLVVLQQFFPKATELFFYTPAGDLASVTKLMTKAGSTLFIMPPNLNLAFIALTKEDAENMEWEGVSLDRKWRMCMGRERRGDEVVDPVARGLVNDLARHMRCLQEQLDQVKRQQLQLILNQIVNTDRPTTEVEPTGKSWSENAIEKENSNMADAGPQLMGDMETGKEGSLQGSGGETVSTFLPSEQRLKGDTIEKGTAGNSDSESTRASLLITDEKGEAMNKMKVLKSEETDCNFQGVVTIRPRIIKRQIVSVNSLISVDM